MKFLIFSDLHVEDYGGNRLNDCLEVIRTLFKEADEQEADILFAGDLVDKAASLKSHVITALYNVLAECFYTYPSVKFIGVSGNHDMTKRYGESETSILRLFHSAFSNFICIDSAAHYTLNGIDIHGVPFYDKRELLVSHLNSVKRTNTAMILLTHQSDPLTPFADIFVDDVKGFDWCFNGHIHKYNQHTERFFTVGNPLWRNASDTGDQKGYLILDTVADEVKRVLLNFPEHIRALSTGKEASTMYVAPASLSNQELFIEYCKFAQLEPEVIATGQNYI